MTKVIFEPNLLSAALKKLSPAINNNAILPVLSYIRVDVKKDTAFITASNLKLTLTVEVGCTSETEFKVLLPFADIAKISSVVSSPMSVTVGEKNIEVESGFDSYQLAVAGDIGEFPEMQAIKEPKTFEANKDIIDAMVTATKLCDPKDDRFASICLHFKLGKLRIVGTTSSHLYYREFDMPGMQECKISVPSNFPGTISEYPKALISFSERNISAECFGLKSIITLSEYRFPNYESILDNFTPTWNGSFEMAEFREAVKKVFVFNSSDSTLLLKPEKNKMELLFSDAITNRDSKSYVDSEIETEVTKIGLNQTILSNVLSTFPKDAGKVDISLQSPSRPIFFRLHDDNTSKVLMMPTIITAN